MGNTVPQSRGDRRLSHDEREEMRKFFRDDELHLIKQTFKGMANTKKGYIVDKETFLKCFPMPGLLGERLFDVIGRENSGCINYYEFVQGVAIIFRGSRVERMKFIFDLFDLNDTGFVSRHELITMLHQYPQSAYDILETAAQCSDTTTVNQNLTMTIDAIVDVAFPSSRGDEPLSFEEFCTWCDNIPGIFNIILSIFPYLNSSPNLPGMTSNSSNMQDMYKSPSPKRRKSFEDLSSSVHPIRGSMPLPQSISYATELTELQQTKCLLMKAKQKCKIEEIKIHIDSAIAALDKRVSTTVGCTRPIISPIFVKVAYPEAEISSNSQQENILNPRMHGVMNSEYVNELSNSENLSGEMYKRGSRLGYMTKRYFVLQGNFLYYYMTKNDTAPRGVMFLCDCYVEIPSLAIVVEKNVTYYPIEIVPEIESGREKRTVYTKSLEEQMHWMHHLQRATDKICIEEFYTIGSQLGRGRFSKVCEATIKTKSADLSSSNIGSLGHDQLKHAVKIIDKEKLIGTEKELLRTEIAILKLVTHPNIIRLHDVFEDRQNIYIVTELVSGGELFNRIVGRSRYTETEAKSVMLPLLEAVAYLHKLGIVHRDIKPENILCGEQLGELKIADFGLSKLVHPEEIMKMPCGTLNYVAPEVLSLVGYGKEADIWSVGVIMYLLLRGELPFHGKSKNEIIQKTLHAEISIDTEVAWSGVSPSCKNLLKGLLTKEPSKRLTAAEALKHEWLIPKIGNSYFDKEQAKFYQIGRRATLPPMRIS